MPARNRCETALRVKVASLDTLKKDTRMKLGFTSATLALSMVICSALPLAAFDLPEPAGDVILTVSGAIATTNADGVAKFDIDLLNSLPQHSFTTTTIWTEGANTYQGVLLKDLLEAIGAAGSTISATALNDYQISFPASEIGDDAPLVAYLADGKPMSVREKGPLWLIYPFDGNSDYRTEETYARSIWQMDRLNIAD